MTTHLRDLTADPRNARHHGPRNVEMIADALQQVGAARSIVIDEDGLILAGNATVEAAAQAGLERVKIVEADGDELIAVRRRNLTPEQKTKLALYDNRTAELATWDSEVLAELGRELELAELFSAEELDAILAEVATPTAGATDADAVPELPVEPITQPGDCWQLGRHRLLCGDSTNPDDVRRLMAGQRAALMATDPPYLVNYRGGNHPQSWHNRPEVKDKHWDDYREGETDDLYDRFLAVALAHALGDRPALYQWHASIRYGLVAAAWQANGLLPHQQLIWVKARPILTRSHFMWQHEPCLYGWVQGRVPPRTPPANATTVWPVDQQGESDGIHPTQKPVELFARPIACHTAPGDLLYEPFSGSGTALIAAEREGRTCYALELAPEFVDVAVQRWEEFTGGTAERLPAGS